MTDSPAVQAVAGMLLLGAVLLLALAWWLRAGRQPAARHWVRRVDRTDRRWITQHWTEATVLVVLPAAGGGLTVLALLLLLGETLGGLYAPLLVAVLVAETLVWVAVLRPRLLPLRLYPSWLRDARAKEAGAPPRRPPRR
jgi:hypothetical protein